MTDLDARLALLRARFLSRCQTDLDRILHEAPSPEELHQIAHKVAGMAGTIGLPQLGEAALAYDRRMQEGVADTTDRQAFIIALTDAVNG